MGMLEEVRRLHKAGYDLIPLKGKRPISNNWVEMPRLELEELKKYMSNGHNVGIRLGQPMSDGRFLACLDVDIVGSLTPQEKASLQEAIGDYSTGAIAVTGFGNQSRHIYVASPQPVKTSKLGQAERVVEYTKAGKTKKGRVWTVELRGYGAQTVLPPSIHPDTQTKYKWKPGSRLNGADGLPEIDPLNAQSKRTQGPGAQTQSIPAIAPLYKTILTTGDVADYPSRSEALYAVLCVLVRDTELSDEDIEALVLSQPLGDKARERPTGWVSKQCSKLRAQSTDALSRIRRLSAPATLADIKPILEEAAKAGLSPAEREEFLNAAKKLTGISKAALTSELDASRGDALNQTARLAHGDPVYEEVLNRHAIVSWAGKPAVFRERKNPPTWEGRYDIMTLTALATFYENKPVILGKKAANPVEIWRADASRREFLEGARLVPPEETCPEGVFNLWQGFACSPQKGSVKLWTTFLKEVICGGHETHFLWLEDWIADLFQNIGNPKGVAVVLRGEEGIGKGTFANTLGAIVGPHYRHVTQESHLTGKFNAHFADSTLIFADELIWGGDKKHRGALYAIVTEKHLMVERKNFDAVPMRNLNRMVIASNNDWVVPTGMDGRRWFVLDVANKHKRNTRYFEKMRRWLNDKGGYEAILDHYLNHRIVSDLRRAPVTDALIEQKIAGFDSVSAWWKEVLDRGSIRGPIGDTVGEWEVRVSKELLRSSYQGFCKDHGMKPHYEVLVLKRIYHLSGGVVVRARDGEKRVHVVDFPELDVCRQRLDDMLGSLLD